MDKQVVSSDCRNIIESTRAKKWKIFPLEDFQLEEIDREMAVLCANQISGFLNANSEGYISSENEESESENDSDDEESDD